MKLGKQIQNFEKQLNNHRELDHIDEATILLLKDVKTLFRDILN